VRASFVNSDLGGRDIDSRERERERTRSRFLNVAGMRKRSDAIDLALAASNAISPGSRFNIGVKILFRPASRDGRTGSLLETKGVPGPPVATRERANYNSICPYGFRYHQPRRFSARARRARPIAAAFCFVITSILPPSFSPHPLSFLRGGISNFCRILLVSTFSALDIIDIVRTACVTRGASEAFRKKFLSPRGNFSLPLFFFYADSSANYEILPRYPIARCGVNKDARTRGWKFMRRAEFRGNAR